MPLYEYKCLRCGTSIEVLQKVGDSSLKKCVKCGGTLEKVISPPALQFKGEGWYVTDYAMKNKPEKKEKPPKEKAKDKKADSSKKEKSESSSSKD
jgi:putative FmdB family regulatory protein